MPTNQAATIIVKRFGETIREHRFTIRNRGMEFDRRLAHPFAIPEAF